MNRRDYKTYSDYVAHQVDGYHKQTPDAIRLGQSKVCEKEIHWCREWFLILKPYIDLSTAKALCLGARFGEEVVAFREFGCDAMGLDLVPNLPLVIAGDFHDIDMPDGTFDIVYSNALDHVLYLETFVSESARVLKPGGLLLYHIPMGQGCGGECWECLSIQKAGEVADLLGGFEILYNDVLTPKRGGLNYCILARKKQ